MTKEELIMKAPDLSSAELLMRSWQEQPRPLFIVDECRTSIEGGGQYTLFSIVQTNTKSAIDWMKESEDIKRCCSNIKKLPAALKGRCLFGKRKQVFHEPYRQYVLSKLKSAEQLSFFLVDSVTLSTLNKKKGGITCQQQDGSLSRVSGPELNPVQCCIKIIAHERKLQDPFIDILVDRSYQLGLDPKSRQIKNDQLEVLKHVPWNSVSGGQAAQLMVPNQFAIIPGRDEGKYSDLLVLPDSLAYIIMFRCNDYLKQYKENIQQYKQPWYWHDNYSNISILKKFENCT